MAVPKKKKSSAATKRQRNAYVLTQRKKILGMVSREMRHEKAQDILLTEEMAKKSKNITVVHA